MSEAHVRDKPKDIGIILENPDVVESQAEVMPMAEGRKELLNNVYREISEKLGMEVAMEIFQLFKGQQISFPMRFFNPSLIQQSILDEYDGTNVRLLATKYNYSEKTVRRIIKESTKGDKQS